MIKVVNKHTHVPTIYDYYVGRGSILGNRYTSKSLNETKAEIQCETREETVEMYQIELINRIENKDKEICDELNKIYKMAKEGDVFLVCYCSPLLCHGDVIKQIIENKLKK